MSCKHRMKSVLGKEYTRCRRDNSVHRKPCKCPKYEPTLRERIKRFFNGRKYG